MKKMQGIAAALSFCMLLTGIPVSAADAGTCGENVTWAFDTATGALTISGTGVMTDYEDTDDIPWYSFADNIRTVVIEEGVTTVGSGAFFYCSSLTSAVIPEGVTSIGDMAFWGCSALEDITFPDGLTYIGGLAFEYCESLRSAILPDSVTMTGPAVFDGCSALQQVRLSENMTALYTYDDGDYYYGYFMDCAALESITIPKSITEVDAATFYYCSNLTSVTFENPDCNIYPIAETICSSVDEEGNACFNGTIYGYANSTAQTYADTCGYAFELIGDAPVVILGDVNGDGAVDASDAAEILIEATQIGAGLSGTFTEAQTLAADVNSDESVDASDAAVILVYAAAMGAGGSSELRVEDFV